VGERLQLADNARFGHVSIVARLSDIAYIGITLWIAKDAGADC
jgi:hypothetical protein